MTDEPSGEVLLYQRDGGVPGVEVHLDGDTVWLTQAQLVELFGSSKASISEHISNVFDEGELSQESTVREFRTVRTEGAREVTRSITHYNLDLVISVGYRVKSLIQTVVDALTRFFERFFGLGAGGGE